MAITPSGKSFLVSTINDMLSIGTSSLLAGDICLVSFEPNYNGTTKIFVYDATRPSSGYGDWHIYRNANITRCIANQTARDYDDNVLFDGMKNGEIVINPNKNTLFYKDIIGQKVYEIAGADSVSTFLPRVFYSFKILGGVATFDNATNIIKKNELLLCTESDGSLSFNKGTQYQIDTETVTPTTAMLSSFLTPLQMVGKQLILHRDFNNYPKGTYTANDAETDLINYADLKANQSTTYTKIENDTALGLKQNNIILVATQADMLALAGVEIGQSVVYVIADKIQYQLTATPSSNISSWTAIATSGSGSGGFSVTEDTTTTTLDLNNVTETGITNFSAVTSLTNGPTGIVPIAGKLLTVGNYFSTNGIKQNLLLNDNKSFRSYIDSIWSSWQLIATVDTTPNSDIIDALATPPASPSNGDAYVMLENPTGAWSTFAQGTIATYNESTVSWVNTVPANGTAITFSNPVNLKSINSYYIARQTYKYNSAWGSPVIAGLLWQLFVPSSQFQPYNSQPVALSLVSNVVTATCPQNHNLAVGYSVVISDSPNTEFNETVTVTEIVSPTVFKYEKTLANATTTGTLKATTQLLPSGCTSALIPSTISFNIIIAVSSGSYSNGLSFICTNLRSAPCYIAGIPVGKLESISLITNATPQWETVDKKYTVETIPGHSFTNALHQNKIIVNTGDNEYSWTLADGSDLKKVKDGKFLLNVIDADRVLVANGGNTITTFVPHSLTGDKSYSYGNWYNGGAGNLVDGGTLTVGYRATSNLLSYKNEYQIEWTPTNIFFSVIASTPVALQVEAYNKQFALIDGEKLNNVNNILSLVSENTKIKISAATKSVRGKFSGQTVAIRSVNEDFNAALIPVFGLGGLTNSTNPNPNLDPAIKNINSYGNGGSTINFILAINPVGTLFAIPAPTATPNSNFVDAIGDSAIMTAGQIGFELNPLKAYRHNGTAVELYDFILMGQVTWNGSAFSNLINFSFNRKSESDWISVSAGLQYTYTDNLGCNLEHKTVSGTLKLNLAATEGVQIPCKGLNGPNLGQGVQLSKTNNNVKIWVDTFSPFPNQGGDVSGGPTVVSSSSTGIIKIISESTY
jgi:hypothetical protein